MISITALPAPNTSSVAVPRSLGNTANSATAVDQVVLSAGSGSKAARAASGIAGGVVGGAGLGLLGAYGGAYTGLIVSTYLPAGQGAAGLANVLGNMARCMAFGELIGGGLALAAGAAGGALAAIAVYDHFHPEAASPAPGQPTP